jgi:branched-chain amino acid transport system ATP-binding protein
MALDLAAQCGHQQVPSGGALMSALPANSTAAAPLLKVDGLCMRFGGFTALEDVAFELHEGEVFGLLGPNGAGKTTLFNSIAGALRPSAGKISFGGHDITNMRPNQRCALGLARTFQITQPFLDLTVEENVMVGLVPKGVPLARMREEVAQVIVDVGLGHKRLAKARELSTGQRKRLELARALATRPRLIMLDEVTGGVDHASLGGLIELVAGLPARGITVIVVEHNMSMMMKLAHRMMFLNRGLVMVQGEPAQVVSHPDVVNLYLGRPHA